MVRSLFAGKEREGWKLAKLGWGYGAEEGERISSASGGFHENVIDFNAFFSHTYSFVYFKIVYIVEAAYSENMKPMCRFNQLHKFEAAYFSLKILYEMSSL